MRKHLPDKQYFLGKAIPSVPGNYVIQRLLGTGNNAHVFLAHSEELDNDLACKIIPRANLVANWQAEFQKPNKLRTTVCVRTWASTEWQDSEAGIDCIALCSDYVSGISLKDYLHKNKDVGINFIELFLKEMLEFFREMQTKGIQHGDFHAGNILVEDRSESLTGPKHAFRVTDFCVGAVESDMYLGDDYQQLGRITKDLVSQINWELAPPRDRFAYRYIIDEIIPHFLERDITRDPIAKDPIKLHEAIARIDRLFTEKNSQTTAKLITPFDYLSCEQLGDSHSLLKALYSERFLGLSEVESKSNVIVTGPRGCGKSTVYKSLSIKHRISVELDNATDINYLGIYYRCDDLYFSFPRYTLPQREAGYDIPIHYVTATLLSESLSAIRMWAARHFVEQFQSLEISASRALWEILGLKPPQTPSADSFQEIESALRKERRRSMEKQRFVNDPKHEIGSYFGVDILSKACESLISTLPFLENRPFYFLVDDYSSPKISLDLQKNLNRLFMQRAGSFFFKLSTESPVSYASSDIDKKNYVEGREFILLNLGIRFLHAHLRERMDFIEDVFARRLAAIDGYPAHSLEELVGSSPDVPHNQIALEIREGRKPVIWGKQALCNLCSGDVHYLIGLVGKMVSNIGGSDGLRLKIAVPKVDSSVQNKAVRDEAGAFLTNLRRIMNDGAVLVEIVTAFGNVAASYLRYKTSKNEGGTPPHQATRIEPLEELALSDEAKRRYNELLRYSVFMEDVRGKSRRGKVVPRLYLRRFLIPHFGLTFSMRDSLEVEPIEIETLLMSPGQFEARFRLKEAVMEAATNPQMTLDLLEKSDSRSRDE